MNRTGVSRYQRNEVLSLSPERRVVLLYAHVLASLRQAARFLAEGNIEARTKALDKARDIIAELLASLNFEAGGEIARNLASLYAWFMGELLQVDRHRDHARLERVITMVADLHEGWSQAAEAARAPAAQVAGE